MVPPGESITGRPNTIVNSYNRNFPKRNDGSANTLSFVTSPDTVIAIALAGRLDFDPTTDTITAPDGTEVKLDPPVGEVLPDAGLRPGRRTRSRRPRPTRATSRSLSAPPATACSCSSRSRPWDGNDYLDLPVLMKAQGKCTTDHISAAGPWLKYRGHLENISGNLFLGAVNAFTGEAGDGQGHHRRRHPRRIPEIAKHYHEAGIAWVRDRRPQLRRGLVARARRDGAAVPQRAS